MRLMLDTLLALMLAAILVGVVFHRRSDQAVNQSRDGVAEPVDRSPPLRRRARQAEPR